MAGAIVVCSGENACQNRPFLLGILELFQTARQGLHQRLCINTREPGKQKWMNLAADDSIQQNIVFVFFK